MGTDGIVPQKSPSPVSVVGESSQKSFVEKDAKEKEVVPTKLLFTRMFIVMLSLGSILLPNMSKYNTNGLPNPNSCETDECSHGDPALEQKIRGVTLANHTLFLILYLILGDSKEVWFLMCIFNTCAVFASGLDGIFHILLFNVPILGFIYFFLIGTQYTRLFTTSVSASVTTMVYLNLAFHVLLDFLDIYFVTQDVIFLRDASLRKKEKEEPCTDKACVVKGLKDDQIVTGSIHSSLEAAATVFVLLAIFFHQQSLPGVLVFHDEDKAPATDSDEDISESESQISADMLKEGKTFSAHKRSTAKKIKSFLHKRLKDIAHWSKRFFIHLMYGPRKIIRAQDYKVVSQTRKRSAMISLLFIDVPFLIIRFLGKSMMQTQGILLLDDSTLFSMWPKNILCISLQAFWLRNCQRLEVRKLAGERQHPTANQLEIKPRQQERDGKWINYYSPFTPELPKSSKDDKKNPRQPGKSILQAQKSGEKGKKKVRLGIDDDPIIKDHAVKYSDITSFLFSRRIRSLKRDEKQLIDLRRTYLTRFDLDPNASFSTLLIGKDDDSDLSPRGKRLLRLKKNQEMDISEKVDQDNKILHNNLDILPENSNDIGIKRDSFEKIQKKFISSSSVTYSRKTLDPISALEINYRENYHLNSPIRSRIDKSRIFLEKPLSLAVYRHKMKPALFRRPSTQNLNIFVVQTKNVFNFLRCRSCAYFGTVRFRRFLFKICVFTMGIVLGFVMSHHPHLSMIPEPANYREADILAASGIFRPFNDEERQLPRNEIVKKRCDNNACQKPEKLEATVKPSDIKDLPTFFYGR